MIQVGLSVWAFQTTLSGDVAWGSDNNMEMYILLVGAFVEGELHLVIDAIFS
jgi:hypothetical protein